MIRLDGIGWMRATFGPLDEDALAEYLEHAGDDLPSFAPEILEERPAPSEVLGQRLQAVLAAAPPNPAPRRARCSIKISHRTPAALEARVLAMRQLGWGFEEISRIAGVGLSTAYRIVQRCKEIAA